MCRGVPEAHGKGWRGSENWGVRDTHSSPHPPGGEGGWRRGLRAAEGWCLLGGKGRALPVLGEGLRAGEAPRAEAAPCPLVGGTCWAERGGRARRPLGTLSNAVLHLARVGIDSLAAAPLVWLLQELGTLDGLFVLLLLPLFPSSSSRCLFSARYRHFQRRLRLVAAVEATSRDFGSFPSGVFFEEGRVALPSTMGFSPRAKMDFH